VKPVRKGVAGRSPIHDRRHAVAVCLILACYACGRVLEVVHGPPATVPLVAIEVLSAFVLAIVDGARNWGIRGIIVFTGICAIVGNTVENLGVATGFPFGRYHFLDVMGPKLFAVPVLLGLAYIGMAYSSWVLASEVAGRIPAGASRSRIVIAPFVAAFFMTAWDLAQDPVWSTMLHAWAWRDGGPWFGVPLENYFGWFLTVFLIFFLFARFERRCVTERPASTWPALALYILCALGNALQLLTRWYAPLSIDASGRSWPTSEILAASALVSVLVMGGFAAIAVARTVGRAKD
jgi:putative membrane protein